MRHIRFQSQEHVRYVYNYRRAICAVPVSQAPSRSGPGPPGYLAYETRWGGHILHTLDTRGKERTVRTGSSRGRGRSSRGLGSVLANQISRCSDQRSSAWRIAVYARFHAPRRPVRTEIRFEGSTHLCWRCTRRRTWPGVDPAAGHIPRGGRTCWLPVECSRRSTMHMQDCFGSKFH